jgi:hypothetical protein
MVVALRTLGSAALDADDAPYEPLPRPNPNDWLTLEQAACELGCSVSTIRRRIRSGELRNRIVPRKGGYAYRIYIQNSRHGRASLTGELACAPTERTKREPLAPRDMQAFRRARQARMASPMAPPGPVGRIGEALARVLGAQRMPLPAGAEAGMQHDDPYARYRWLVRKQRRWWR